MSNSDKEKFLEAVKEGHLDKVKEMLSKPGFNVNVKNKTNKTALMIASNAGNTEIIKLLLEMINII